MSKVVVYAIGGNALSDPKNPDSKDSEEILDLVIDDVIDLLEADWRVVLTHGNGPQVGHLMTIDTENTESMDSWVSATQGMIGHSLSLKLDSRLRTRNRPERSAVVLTRVEVDERDSAFQNPTKPVGPVLAEDDDVPSDWNVIKTEHGIRRVVPSPLPVSIIDADLIRSLVDLRAVVICGGGGGIPVSNNAGNFRGIEAVIDKDRVSSLLAVSLNADALVISTGIDSVKVNFGKEDELSIRKMTVVEALNLLEQGEFPAGSMAPKIGSLIEAVNNLPKMKAVLCAPGNAISTLREMSGTTIET